MISWLWLIPTFAVAFGIGYWLGGWLPFVLAYFREGSPIG